MIELKRLAIDTSKHVFTLHGVDASDRPVLRRELRRGRWEAFLAGLAPTEVVLEACGGSHHWGRRALALGHRVRLIPPQYVKPFVRRGKNDRIDAEAIAEAAARPGMAEVAVKSAEAQAQGMLLKMRELLVKQRTQLANALRGHAAEYGLVAAQGMSQVEPLLAAVAADPAIPPLAKAVLARLGQQVAHLDAEIAALDAELLALHKAHPISRLLEGVPGIGPVTAISLALAIDPAQFTSGRHLAAFLGLTPRQHSTGGKTRLGRISRAGNRRLRTLLVVGASAVIRHVRPGARLASPWLLALLARKPRKLAAVALANKMARIVWAMMTRGEAYRRPTGSARRHAGDRRHAGRRLSRASVPPVQECSRKAMAFGRSERRDTLGAFVARRGRLSVQGPPAQPIRASGQRAAPTGRTHDRNRTARQIPTATALATEGPSTHERSNTHPAGPDRTRSSEPGGGPPPAAQGPILSEQSTAHPIGPDRARSSEPGGGPLPDARGPILSEWSTMRPAGSDRSRSPEPDGCSPPDAPVSILSEWSTMHPPGSDRSRSPEPGGRRSPVAQRSLLSETRRRRPACPGSPIVSERSATRRAEARPRMDESPRPVDRRQAGRSRGHPPGRRAAQTSAPRGAAPGRPA